MLEDQYEYFADDDHLNYEFISEGHNGRIKKVIQFSKTIIKGVEA